MVTGVGRGVVVVEIAQHHHLVAFFRLLDRHRSHCLGLCLPLEPAVLVPRESQQMEADQSDLRVADLQSGHVVFRNRLSRSPALALPAVVLERRRRIDPSQQADVLTCLTVVAVDQVRLVPAALEELVVQRGEGGDVLDFA